MGVQEIVGYISNVGFPIVMCGAMMWYVQTQLTSFKDVISECTTVLSKLYDEIIDTKEK